MFPGEPVHRAAERVRVPGHPQVDEEVHAGQKPVAGLDDLQLLEPGGEPRLVQVGPHAQCHLHVGVHVVQLDLRRRRVFQEIELAGPEIRPGRVDQPEEVEPGQLHLVPGVDELLAPQGHFGPGRHQLGLRQPPHPDDLPGLLELFPGEAHGLLEDSKLPQGQGVVPVGRLGPGRQGLRRPAELVLGNVGADLRLPEAGDVDLPSPSSEERLGEAQTGAGRVARVEPVRPQPLRGQADPHVRPCGEEFRGAHVDLDLVGSGVPGRGDVEGGLHLRGGRPGVDHRVEHGPLLVLEGPLDLRGDPVDAEAAVVVQGHEHRLLHRDAHRSRGDGLSLGGRRLTVLPRGRARGREAEQEKGCDPGPCSVLQAHASLPLSAVPGDSPAAGRALRPPLRSNSE